MLTILSKKDWRLNNATKWEIFSTLGLMSYI